jgi:putative ABC transport system permease protein
MRQSITESLVLAALGGTLGFALAAWGTRMMIARGAAALPMLQNVTMNVTVLLFSLGVVLLTAIGLSLAPLRVFGGDLAGALSGGARRPGGAGSSMRLRRNLVGFEAGLSAALLLMAGLLVHSFTRLMGVDRGFQVDHIVCMDLALGQGYPNSSARISFYRELLERLRALPGVAAAGATSTVPLTDEPGPSSIYLESDTAIDETNLKRPTASYSVITPGYFAAAGIPLRAGRLPLEQEQQAIPVVWIGEKLAQALWPGESLAAVLGRRIRFGSPGASLWTVAGIVGDVRLGSLEQPSVPQIYRPHRQAPASRMSVVVRTGSDETNALAAALRDAVHRSDKNLPVSNLRSMSEVVSNSVAQRRFQMLLVSLFAAAALTLALVGIYGLVSYSVACRTHDIGLRMALGASREDILRSVLLTALRPVAAGLVCGIAGALAAAQTLRSLLFGVGPVDPAAVGAVALILPIASAAACYLPARRAAALDPSAAIRCE